MYIICWGPIFILVTIVLTYLYEISWEFAIYYLLFGLISWICLMLFDRKKNTRSQRDKEREEIPNIEEDKGWIEKKEKEDFFTLWTHQIKTPIAAINLLFQAPEPDIGKCKLEIFKIEEYVEMALNYLRYDSMSNDLVLEDYSLDKLVRMVVKKHSLVFIHRHLTVTLENLEQQVLTDDKWFSFVLDQILSNALKYTKEGGITISSSQNEGHVILSITDTGIGIRQEDIPRLFEKGFTGYNGRMDKKASGLGLYLCKGVCDKLGHVLKIESKENVGTKVTIIFPKESVDQVSMNRI